MNRIYAATSLCLAALAPSAMGQEIGCFIQGECLHSNLVGLSNERNAYECLEFCQDTNACTHFSYILHDDACVAYSECVELDPSCTDCISGDANCIKCGEHGQVDGVFEALLDVEDEDDCIANCYLNPLCKFWTYDTREDYCSMFSTFVKLDDVRDTRSGPKSCYDGPFTTVAPADTTTTQGTTAAPESTAAPTTTAAPVTTATPATTVAK